MPADGIDFLAISDGTVMTFEPLKDKALTFAMLWLDLEPWQVAGAAQVRRGVETAWQLVNLLASEGWQVEVR